LQASFADLSSTEELEKAIKPNTRMLWVESPTNPLLKLVDLQALAAIARKRRLLAVCDNTFASPWIQRPLEHGFDIVVHSTTKYINGHSDVIGGAAIIREDEALKEKLAFLQNAVGGVPSPFDAFLTLRGIKTLALRMERHCANALEVARFLQSHPKVQKVFYPGLESHPQHALAKRQMNGRYGGMVTAVLKGGLERSRRFLERCKLFTLAVLAKSERNADLETAARYIESAFGSSESQYFESGGRKVRNIQTTQAASIVVGAHYDTVPGSPGADDNASAVAVLIELAAMRL